MVEMVEVLILSKIVVILSVSHLVTTCISSQLEISHVLNGTTAKIQPRKCIPAMRTENVLKTGFSLREKNFTGKTLFSLQGWVSSDIQFELTIVG